jgi:hypothetical protein
MSPKSQINFRASVQLKAQLEALVRKTGALQTEVISTAIDRMYQQDIQQPGNPGTYPPQNAPPPSPP